MHAAVLHALGKPPRFEEFPDPTPGEGEVLINVSAAALKPVFKRHSSSDWKRRLNNEPQSGNIFVADLHIQLGVKRVEVRWLWRQLCVNRVGAARNAPHFKFTIGSCRC